MTYDIPYGLATARTRSKVPVNGRNSTTSKSAMPVEYCAVGVLSMNWSISPCQILSHVANLGLNITLIAHRSQGHAK